MATHRPLAFLLLTTGINLASAQTYTFNVFAGEAGYGDADDRGP